MGSAESNPIRNMDKRTARREYKSDFCRAVGRYREVNKDGIQVTQNAIRSDDADGCAGIKVFVRKRPIFKKEIELDEFDVITCLGGNQVTVHDARMHTDMRRMFMNHHEFFFDQVFDERCDNLGVYSGSTAPLVQIAVDGGFSTCIVYGQTGSGKTFTMSSIYEQAAYEIFVRLESLSEQGQVLPKVSVSFVEISGDLCFDLFNAFAETQILAGNDGSFHAFPVVEPCVSSPEELIALIQFARSIRTTAATGVHDASSRSHAVLKIYVHRPVAPTAAAGASIYDMATTSYAEGTLTLVDLAGSEHRIDSMHHTAERRKEGAAINASLMALKECIRARAANQNFGYHYRKSKLTMVLKQSFSNPAAHTVMIATVSPASKDTEHSLNTLRHACIMDGQSSGAEGGETRFTTGGTVHTVEVGAIDVSQISKRNKEAIKTGDGVAGMKSSNGNTLDGAKKGADRELTDKEKARMRRVAVKKGLAQLRPEVRRVMDAALGCLRMDPRQKYRLQTGPVSSLAAAVAAAQEKEAAEDDDGGNGVETLARYEKNHNGDSNGSGSGKGKGKGNGAELFCAAGVGTNAGIEDEDEEENEGEERHDDDMDDWVRVPYNQLYDNVYKSHNKAPDAVKRRQLTTLMKMNGYNEDEIARLAPPSPTERFLDKSKVGAGAGLSRRRATESVSTGKQQGEGQELDSSGVRGRDGDDHVLTQVEKQAGTKHSTNGIRTLRRQSADDVDSLKQQAVGDGGRSAAGRATGTQLAADDDDDDATPSPRGIRSTSENVAPPPVLSSSSAKSSRAQRDQTIGEAAQLLEQEAAVRRNRHTQAREKRLRAEEEKREALRAKLNLPLQSANLISAGSSSSDSGPSGGSGRLDREEEIAKLEDMLMTGDGLSAAAIFALNKQIAAHRAALIRETRKLNVLQSNDGAGNQPDSTRGDTDRDSARGAGRGSSSGGSGRRAAGQNTQASENGERFDSEAPLLNRDGSRQLGAVSASRASAGRQRAFVSAEQQQQQEGEEDFQQQEQEETYFSPRQPSLSSSKSSPNILQSNPVKSRNANVEQYEHVQGQGQGQGPGQRRVVMSQRNSEEEGRRRGGNGRSYQPEAVTKDMQGEKERDIQGQRDGERERGRAATGNQRFSGAGSLSSKKAGPKPRPKWQPICEIPQHEGEEEEVIVPKDAHRSSPRLSAPGTHAGSDSSSLSPGAGAGYVPQGGYEKIGSRQSTTSASASAPSSSLVAGSNISSGEGYRDNASDWDDSAPVAYQRQSGADRVTVGHEATVSPRQSWVGDSRRSHGPPSHRVFDEVNEDRQQPPTSNRQYHQNQNRNQQQQQQQQQQQRYQFHDSESHSSSLSPQPRALQPPSPSSYSQGAGLGARPISPGIDRDGVPWGAGNGPGLTTIQPVYGQEQHGSARRSTVTVGYEPTIPSQTAPGVRVQSIAPASHSRDGGWDQRQGQQQSQWSQQPRRSTIPTEQDDYQNHQSYENYENYEASGVTRSYVLGRPQYTGASTSAHPAGQYSRPAQSGQGPGQGQGQQGLLTHNQFSHGPYSQGEYQAGGYSAAASASAAPAAVPPVQLSEYAPNSSSFDRGMIADRGTQGQQIQQQYQYQQPQQQPPAIFHIRQQQQQYQYQQPQQEQYQQQQQQQQQQQERRNFGDIIDEQVPSRRAAYSGRAAASGFVQEAAAVVEAPRRAGRHSAGAVGAASAPFANDYSWAQADT